MICNLKMAKILNQIDQNNLSTKKVLPIWVKKNNMGEVFWGVDNFCGCIGKKPTSLQGKNLTDLEWDGNEININRWEDDKINASSIIIDVIGEALSIVKGWKIQLEKEYTDTCFDIILSLDEGDEDVPPSATVRFYAVRDSYHYISLDFNFLEECNQPVLIEQVNSSI